MKLSKIRILIEKAERSVSMCTAVSLSAGDHYFGRNLDYEHSFGEKIVLTPKLFPLCSETEHYAIIGTALPVNNYPLYFDAVNESGLCMAGLLFPGLAHYHPPRPDKENIPSYELIPRILARYKTVSEARRFLKQVNITNESFSSDLSPSPLHWLIADKKESLTVEQTNDGLFLYENPLGVLTNSPAFPMQVCMLNNYLSVSAKEPENRFSDAISLTPYSRGMGGLGLPGDLSSMSRFTRASFTKLNAVFNGREEEKVHQFFHVLQSVFQVKGCAQVGKEFEQTNYSVCYNATQGIYYYKTYDNSCIRGIDMNRETLLSDKLKIFPMTESEPIAMQN